MRRVAKIILATRKVSVYSKKLGFKQHHLQAVDYSYPGRTVAMDVSEPPKATIVIHICVKHCTR